MSEYRSCFKFNGDGDSAACFQINPMQLADRTVYHDDSNKYRETRGVEVDGAGHFRKSILDDNFAGASTRSTTTAYDATNGEVLSINSTTGYVQAGMPMSYLPMPSQAWILTTFEKQTTVGDGRTYTVETEFDDEGSLTCERTWRDTNARSSQDRVVQLDRGTAVGTNAGLPVTETVSGGDFASLQTDAVCSIDTTGVNGRRYIFDHQYDHLQLASTRIGNFPFRYRAEIDSGYRSTAPATCVYGSRMSTPAPAVGPRETPGA